MSEYQTTGPEHLPADQFILAVQQSQGNPYAILQDHPYLATEFVGQDAQSLGKDFDRDNRGYAPVPLVDALHRWELNEGDSILARGIFDVVQTDDGYNLRFTANSKYLMLQSLDADTAAAFINYGPTYTEATLGVLQRSDTLNGKEYDVFLEAVTAVQSPLESVKEFQPNEMVHIDGVVTGYVAGRPNSNPRTGETVITKKPIEDDIRTDLKTTAVVRLLDGSEVTLQHGTDREMTYDIDCGAVLSEQSLLEGDTVRILARRLMPHEPGHTEQNILDPKYIQLRYPSEQRAVAEREWRDKIDQRLAALVNSSQENILRPLQSLFLASAYQDGGDPRFKLDEQQKQAIWSVVGNAFADNPNDLPLSAHALKSASALALLAEASQECGKKILTMTKDGIVGELYKRTFKDKAEFSHLPELLAEVCSGQERLSIASAIFGSGNVYSKKAYRGALKSVVAVTDGIFNKPKAEILSHALLAVPESKDSSFYFSDVNDTVSHYLEEELWNMFRKAGDDNTLQDQLEALGVYWDTLNQLSPQFAKSKTTSHQHAFHEVTAVYYQAARRNGLLP